MSLPTKFSVLISHEPGVSIVGRAEDGLIYTVQREGGNVSILSPGIETTVLHNGAENVAKIIVDSYLPDTAAAPRERKPLGPMLAVALAIFTVSVGGTGLIALEMKRKADMTQQAIAVSEVAEPTPVEPLTVEEANAGNRPAEPAAPAPAQPQVELPSRVTTDPAATAAVPEPANSDDPKATGAAVIAERTTAAIEDMNGTQAAARDLVAEQGPEVANTQLADMRDALTTLTSGGKLTPEALNRLPHELAEQLRAAGAIQSLEEVAAGQDFSIIRLPPAIVDSYMDADGIPTIPDANGWMATGGVVRVPLPGGGDVSRPEHLLAFGLEP